MYTLENSDTVLNVTVGSIWLLCNLDTEPLTADSLAQLVVYRTIVTSAND